MFCFESVLAVSSRFVTERVKFCIELSTDLAKLVSLFEFSCSAGVLLEEIALEGLD